MSSDFHLKFDGVDGEASHKDHKGEIEVLSWSWGVTQASGSGSGGGSGKGKASPGEFHFVHQYDKASPVLAKHCVGGKHFKDAKLTARKAGEGQKDFLVITLKEVFISSVQPSGSQGGDVLENVSCSYKDVEFAYKAQDDKGGLGGEVKFGWNTATTETR
ncbi:MAG: type VI secretion system tube protein Hcp [Cytophagales bacterium]|nr:type VI secretion system tube protein Hcp [Rhizobacter sp.]